MSSRPSDPKIVPETKCSCHWWLGSGKTLAETSQMHSSYVVTDPKGTILSMRKAYSDITPSWGKDGKPMKDKHGKVIYGHKLD